MNGTALKPGESLYDEALAYAARIALGLVRGLSVCVAPPVEPGQKMRLTIQWQACELEPAVADFHRRLGRQWIEVAPEQWRMTLRTELARDAAPEHVPSEESGAVTKPWVAVHMVPVMEVRS